MGNAWALGAGSLSISSGVSLDAAIPLTLLSNTPQIWSDLVKFVGSNSLNMGRGSVTLTSDTLVQVNAGSLTLGGNVLGGGFALNKSGLGTLILSGTNAYSGSTNVLAGTLILNGPGALPIGSLLNVSGRHRLWLSTGAQSRLASWIVRRP